MKPRPKVNVSQDMLNQVTNNIFNPKPNKVVIKSNTFQKNLGYKPNDQLLTIKSMTNTGYKITLSDGSQWSKVKKSFFHSDYTVGAAVKVSPARLPGLKSLDAFTIEIPGKAHGSENWYFDGYEGK